MQGYPLEQLLTPIFLGILLTYHWYDWRTHSIPEERVLGL
jgi:hypothetical protein